MQTKPDVALCKNRHRLVVTRDLGLLTDPK